MKFEVGDKVISEDDLNRLLSPYHSKNDKKGLIRSVTEANEDMFTIYNYKGNEDTVLENALSCGANSFMAFRQSTGETINWKGSTQLHLEKDKKQIKMLIVELSKSLGEANNQELVDDIKKVMENFETVKERNSQNEALAFELLSLEVK